MKRKFLWTKVVTDVSRLTHRRTHVGWHSNGGLRLHLLVYVMSCSRRSREQRVKKGRAPRGGRQARRGVRATDRVRSLDPCWGLDVDNVRTVGSSRRPSTALGWFLTEISTGPRTSERTGADSGLLREAAAGFAHAFDVRTDFLAATAKVYPLVVRGAR